MITTRQRTYALALLLAGCASAAPTPDPALLKQQVMNAEHSFARTMAERDHEAFTSFLSKEAVFFAGERPIRGKAAVAAAWKRFFTDAQAPFSWEPDHVEVLPSGILAFSTGPVFDPSGKIIGRFNSIWRQEQPGQWRVVFDKGCPVGNEIDVGEQATRRPSTDTSEGYATADDGARPGRISRRT